MNKAVLSNRIYMNASDELIEVIDKTLTYKIPARNPEDPPVIIKQMSKIRAGLITIPIGRTDLIPDNYEVVEKRTTYPVDLPEFKATLDPAQREVYDQVDDNIILNAKVGWGKTFTALAIACKLGQKTLVVCHTTSLMRQWVEEVEKVLGITPGIAGTGKFNLASPIVIGSVRTLYNRIPEISEQFGTLILDEVHHVSAKTFSAIVDKSTARYKIGLSGTVKRKDGKHVVFKDYFSDNMIQPENTRGLTPEVHLIKTDTQIPGGPGVPWANRMTELAHDPEYQQLICSLAEAYRLKGHKVLILSDRVHLVNVCSQMLPDTSVAVTGAIKDYDERQALQKALQTDKDQLFGILSMFSEGFSEKVLSCLILATPTNNEPLLEQICGRVNRESPGKPKPIIVDVVLKGGTARNQLNTRVGYYMSEGWKIKSFTT